MTRLRVDALGDRRMRVPATSASGLLRSATLYLDAASHDGGQTVTNLGVGGSALDAQSGSTSGADTNDPLWLGHDGTNYVYLPGVNGNYLSTPDVAALDITGDIDIRVRVALDDWTPAAEGYLLSKWSSGQQSYILAVTTGGNLCLYWTTNGSTNILRTSTAALTVTDGADSWIRATLDVDNGAAGHDAAFYTSTDGTSWMQLGTTVTTAGTTSIWSGSAQVEVGTHSSGTSSTGGPGKYYRAVVKSGIDGTTVLDVDTSAITSGSATSFTATTGQTVTINRSTSGRKAVAVTAPVWLLGTDDYLQVADNDLLDFGASDSFTVLAVRRKWTAPDGTARGIVIKTASLGAAAGWGLHDEGGSSFVTIHDGSAYLYDIAGSPTLGATSALWGVRDTTADTIAAGYGTLASPTSDTSTGSLASSSTVRVGGRTNYVDMELLAVAVWRRALTADEIALVTAYYQERWP